MIKLQSTTIGIGIFGKEEDSRRKPVDLHEKVKPILWVNLGLLGT